MPVDRLLSSSIETFSKTICTKLKNTEFAKRYLQALFDEIMVDGEMATMKGSYAKFPNTTAQMKKGTSKEVPFSYLIGAPETMKRGTGYHAFRFLGNFLTLA